MKQVSKLVGTYTVGVGRQIRKVLGYTDCMKVIKLKDYETQIINALETKKFFSDNSEDFAIAGFGRVGVQDEITDSIILDGRGIPTVIVVAQGSGIVYQVALLLVLPKLKEELDGK